MAQLHQWLRMLRLCRWHCRAVNAFAGHQERPTSSSGQKQADDDDEFNKTPKTLRKTDLEITVRIKNQQFAKLS